MADPMSEEQNHGGKVKSSQTRAGTSRLGQALRMAAESLCRDKSYLGQFYRRMKAKLGGESATVAAAHKIARIIHTLVTKGVAYDESNFARIEKQNEEKTHQGLLRLARMKGYNLAPINI